MNTNFKVIGLTRLEIKPKSTALEASASGVRTGGGGGGGGGGRGVNSPPLTIEK